MEKRSTIKEQCELFREKEKEKENWIYPPKMSYITEEEDQNGISEL